MNSQATLARTRADSTYHNNYNNNNKIYDRNIHQRKYPDNELKYIEIDSQHSRYSHESSSTTTSSRSASHLGVLR